MPPYSAGFLPPFLKEINSKGWSIRAAAKVPLSLSRLQKQKNGGVWIAINPLPTHLVQLFTEGLLYEVVFPMDLVIMTLLV